MEVKNLFENIPAHLNEELFEEIISSPNIKAERIISDGQTSPENFWYDQKENELVFLLKGSAELQFENDKKIYLKPGDYINIPANTKHRVSKTDENDKTVWLAVFY